MTFNILKLKISRMIASKLLFSERSQTFERSLYLQVCNFCLRLVLLGCSCFTLSSPVAVLVVLVSTLTVIEIC